MRKTKKNEKGFTLAELLIVVAIIAVLVAISIPIFTTQLEKSREATDAANLRAAYAEVMAAALTEEDQGEDGPVHRTGNAAGSYTYTYVGGVAAKQTKAEWQSTNIAEIGGIKVGTGTDEIAASTTGWTVVYTESDGKMTITAK